MQRLKTQQRRADGGPLTEPKIRGVLETCVYASDLEAVERFYGAVLGLEVFARQAGRHVFFRCGKGVFLVFDPDATIGATPSHVPTHGSRGPGHMAFAVQEGELEAWRARLERGGVSIETEVSWPQGGRSLYVRDPAGNSIEFATPRIWGIPEPAD